MTIADLLTKWCVLATDIRVYCAHLCWYRGEWFQGILFWIFTCPVFGRFMIILGLIVTSAPCASSSIFQWLSKRVHSSQSGASWTYSIAVKILHSFTYPYLLEDKLWLNSYLWGIIKRKWSRVCSCSCMSNLYQQAWWSHVVRHGLGRCQQVTAWERSLSSYIEVKQDLA